MNSNGAAIPPRRRSSRLREKGYPNLQEEELTDTSSDEDAATHDYTDEFQPSDPEDLSEASDGEVSRASTDTEQEKEQKVEADADAEPKQDSSTKPGQSAGWRAFHLWATAAQYLLYVGFTLYALVLWRTVLPFIYGFVVHVLLPALDCEWILESLPPVLVEYASIGAQYFDAMEEVIGQWWQANVGLPSVVIVYVLIAIEGVLWVAKKIARRFFA